MRAEVRLKLISDAKEGDLTAPVETIRTLALDMSLGAEDFLMALHMLISSNITLMEKDVFSKHEEDISNAHTALKKQIEDAARAKAKAAQQAQEAANKAKGDKNVDEHIKGEKNPKG